MQRKESINSYNPSGSSRKRRHMRALSPDYFKVDERTLVDFLTFAERYAEFVYTKEINGNEKLLKSEKNNWQSFFHSDQSVFFAKLSLLDSDQLAPIFLSEEDLHNNQKVLRQIQDKVSLIINFVRIINDSYDYLLKNALKDYRLSQFMYGTDSIKENLFHIVDHVNQFDIIIDEPFVHSQKFRRIWHPKEKVHKVSFEKEDGALNFLVEQINQFLSGLSLIVRSAKDLFNFSLEHHQYHNPGIALYIAFIQLYGIVQQDLNQFAQKHLDFFYRTLLNQAEKPAEPDHVHVAFTLADHVNNFKIEKGTLFKAGIDEDGFDKLYMATDHLTINKTVVTDLATVYISKKEEIGMEEPYEFVSGIYHSPLSPPPQGNGPDFSDYSISSFGEEQTNLEGQSMDKSEVGFALSSPILKLKEGKRDFRLILNFNLKSMSSLISFLERYTSREGYSLDAAFSKMFSKAFQITLSTENGWFKIRDYRVFPPDWENGSIELYFKMDKGEPSITTPGEWAGKDLSLYDTEWPVLRFILSDKEAMYSYSYLKDLVISSFDIEVCVEGIRDMEVFNDLGQVDISKPFFPFGTYPVVNSSFLIGHEELFMKNIEEFSLNIEWQNLPKNEDGFGEYYKDYNQLINNDSFKVELTALVDFEFHPKVQEKRQVFSLFSTKQSQDLQIKVGNKLQPETKIEVKDLKDLMINGSFENIELPPYDVSSKVGYLRFEMIEPEMAFGHTLYPTILSASLIRGIKNRDVLLPNSPYIPLVKTISLNYKASTFISFKKGASHKTNPHAKEKVYQLMPYGIRTVLKEGTPLIDTLLPQYDYNGYLLLGLDHVVPDEPVTIYFVLDPSIGNEFEVELPEIKWYYVTNDRWIGFDKSHVIFDTTRNFTASGIVKLRIPGLISSNNTILPGKRYWVIAALKGDVKLAAKIKAVYTQALTLEWAAHKEGAMWNGNIAPSTIHSLLKNKTEVGAIFQPCKSFGGRYPEKEQDFYNRISERLRHKNRCVTPWDFERLVLDQFPFVGQVKCISPLDSNNEVTAGKTIIVVVPKNDDFNISRLPKFNYGTLQEIKLCLEKFASSFVELKVINPIYEEIKLTASVRFVNEGKNGIGIETLQRELRDFICPWFTGEEMIFGGTVNLDEVESFIESRPYIGFVTNLSLLILHYNEKKYSISDSVQTEGTDKKLYASKPWVVLVTMKNHQIEVLEEDVYISPEKAAIENMRLGKEFVVSPASKEWEKMEREPEDLLSDDYVAFEIDL